MVLSPLLRIPLLAFLSTFWVIGACESVGEPRQGREIALSLSDGGDILLLYNPCVNSLVSAVQLVQVHGRIFGDEDDQLLWRIEAGSPTAVTELQSGSAIPGFVEIMPLPDTVSGDLGAQIFPADAERFDGRQFTPEELKVGLYLDARNKYLTREHFLELDTCDL